MMCRGLGLGLETKIFEAVSIATQLIVTYDATCQVNGAWFWNIEMHVMESLPRSWSEVVTSVTSSQLVSSLGLKEGDQ